MRLRNIILAAFFTILVSGGLSPAFSEDKAPAVKADVKPELFTVVRFVIARDVKDREPVDIVDVLPASTDKAYCFLEVKDVSADTDAEFVWYLGDKEMRTTSVTLKQGPRWRTYANKTINGLRGDWRVDIRDANGTILKSVNFKVE